MCWRSREDQGITLLFFLLLRALQFTKAAHTKFDICPLAAPSSFIISPLTSQLPQLPQLIYVPAHTQLIPSLCSCPNRSSYRSSSTHLYARSQLGAGSVYVRTYQRARGLCTGKIFGKNFNMELQYGITIWNYNIKLQYGIKICQYF